MNARQLYGSHPERLSDLLDSLAPEDRDKVHLVGFDENERLASSSLDKLPQTNWGTINWEEAQYLEQQDTPREPEAVEAIRQIISSKISPDSAAVIFWANLAVPTVQTTATIAMKAMDEIIAASHDVWLYFPDDNLLVEHFNEGRVTAARP